jgi:hypothetical protein
MLTHPAKCSLIAVLTALIVCTTAAAQPTPATVVLGSDYFTTVYPPGGTDNFPGIGSVTFKGLPVGPGATDTIVQRIADVTINGGSAPVLNMAALSLESTAPVNLGGSFFDVFVTLDTRTNPATGGLLHPSTGSIAINGTTAGGTWNSTLDVFFEAHFLPVGGGTGFSVFNGDPGGPFGGAPLVLMTTGADWIPNPCPGCLTVMGPLGDLAANVHTGLGPGEVDFFPVPVPGGIHTGPHPVNPTSTPEPSSILLLGPAGIGLLWKLRARRSGPV